MSIISLDSMASVTSTKSAVTTLSNWYWRAQQEQAQTRRLKRQELQQHPHRGDDEYYDNEACARRQRREDMSSLWGTVDDKRHVQVQIGRKKVWVNREMKSDEEQKMEMNKKKRDSKKKNGR